jgi:hypothetical protein
MKMIEGQLRPVKVYPMAEPKPDDQADLGWPQALTMKAAGKSRAMMHRHSPTDFTNYVMTKLDQQT